MKSQYLYIFIFGLLLSGFPQWALGKEPISIDGRHKTLEETLQEVSEASGIQFQIPDSLKEFQIKKDIQGSDWNDAVRKILENFNLVEVNVEGGKLKKVFILGIKNRGSDFQTVNGRPSIDTKRPLEVSKIFLSMDQLRRLAKGPFRSPIPNHLYHEPQLKEFLALHAIGNPEDLDNIQKAMRVRVEARRQLKLLAEQERKSSVQKHRP